VLQCPKISPWIVALKRRRLAGKLAETQALLKNCPVAGRVNLGTVASGGHANDFESGRVVIFNDDTFASEGVSSLSQLINDE